MDKQRLFVDMDGTLAVFKPVDTLETLYEKGYFLNLEPHENVVSAVKDIIKDHPEIEVNILSAYLTDSKYALDEKNAWLDKYLPEIPRENRVFMPCGDNKKDYIEGGVRPNDFLLDDYTKNLNDWQPPARGIKLLNAINHTRGSWAYDRIRYDRTPTELSLGIVSVMKGRLMIKDDKVFNPDKLSGTEFIVQLPKDMQDKIRDAVSRVPSADVETAMNGRLTDLEDNIDWRKVLKGDEQKEKINIKGMISSFKPKSPEPPKNGPGKGKDSYEI